MQSGLTDRPRARDAPGWSAPARAHFAQRALSIGALYQAVVEVSDNTAADLLLAAVDRPQSATQFVRALGDPVTRLDRTELALNLPSGALDTTTPRAMAGSVRSILLGTVLGASTRAMLEGWMVACTTGRTLRWMGGMIFKLGKGAIQK